MLERGEAASAEDHARRGLRRAVQDGHVHKDEEKSAICECAERLRRPRVVGESGRWKRGVSRQSPDQIDPKLRSPLVVVVKYPLNRPRRPIKAHARKLASETSHGLRADKPQ